MGLNHIKYKPSFLVKTDKEGYFHIYWKDGEEEICRTAELYNVQDIMRALEIDLHIQKMENLTAATKGNLNLLLMKLDQINKSKYKRKLKRTNGLEKLWFYLFGVISAGLIILIFL